jgi:hypothetical protein
MRISFHGKVTDEPRIRAGFIGCGSHSFRNIYPALQFAPIELVATCDLDERKAAAFARQFGAETCFSDHRRMLDEADLDAVLIVTNYDERGRPRYPAPAGGLPRLDREAPGGLLRGTGGPAAGGS